MEAPLPGLALLAIIGLLFVSVVQLMRIARYRRSLEAELVDAHATIRALRRRLDEATRPPTQFARMRLRRVAVDRFARLRLAVPPRSPRPEGVDGGHRLRVH